MMQGRRVILIASIVLGLALQAGAGWGSIIEDDFALNQASQIVHLKGVSATGEINFNDLKRVLPGGQEAPFVIPKNRSLLLVRLYFDFKTASTQPNVNLRISPLPFGLYGSSIVSGVASSLATWPVGLPLGGPTDNYKIQAVIPGAGTVIPGNLTVYFTGMLIYPNVSLSPIELLLLLN